MKRAKRTPYYGKRVIYTPRQPNPHKISRYLRRWLDPRYSRIIWQSVDLAQGLDMTVQVRRLPAPSSPPMILFRPGISEEAILRMHYVLMLV